MRAEATKRDGEAAIDGQIERAVAFAPVFGKRDVGRGVGGRGFERDLVEGELFRAFAGDVFEGGGLVVEVVVGEVVLGCGGAWTWSSAW